MANTASKSHASVQEIYRTENISLGKLLLTVNNFPEVTL